MLILYFKSFRIFIIAFILLFSFISLSSTIAMLGDEDEVGPQIKSPPAVHVLMASYNTEKYVLDAIQSIARQTYPNLKLIIYDDGSNDNSAQIIDEYLNKFTEFKSKVDVTFARQNEGVGVARRKLLAKSKEINPSAYILSLDSDDQYTDDDFVKKVMDQMLRTGADICVFNFSVKFEDESQRLNAAGLLKDKARFTGILDKITSSPDQCISPESMDNPFEITSLGCMKCVADTVEYPEAKKCPFEDFVFSSVLLEVKLITALPGDYEPYQYLRRAGSLCGQRKPENFSHDIPEQLKRFYDVVFERSRNAPDRERRLKLARGFVLQKFQQYKGTIENLIAADHPLINKSTYADFLEREKSLLNYMESKF